MWDSHFAMLHRFNQQILENNKIINEKTDIIKQREDFIDYLRDIVNQREDFIDYLRDYYEKKIKKSHDFFKKKFRKKIFVIVRTKFRRATIKFSLKKKKNAKRAKMIKKSKKIFKSQYNKKISLVTPTSSEVQPTNSNPNLINEDLNSKIEKTIQSTPPKSPSLPKATVVSEQVKPKNENPAPSTPLQPVTPFDDDLKPTNEKIISPSSPVSKTVSPQILGQVKDMEENALDNLHFKKTILERFQEEQWNCLINNKKEKPGINCPVIGCNYLARSVGEFDNHAMSIHNYKRCKICEDKSENDEQLKFSFIPYIVHMKHFHKNVYEKMNLNSHVEKMILNYEKKTLNSPENNKNLDATLNPETKNTVSTSPPNEILEHENYEPIPCLKNSSKPSIELSQDEKDKFDKVVKCTKFIEILEDDKNVSEIITLFKNVLFEDNFSSRMSLVIYDRLKDCWITDPHADQRLNALDHLIFLPISYEVNGKKQIFDDKMTSIVDKFFTEEMQDQIFEKYVKINKTSAEEIDSSKWLLISITRRKILVPHLLEYCLMKLFGIEKEKAFLIFKNYSYIETPNAIDKEKEEDLKLKKESIECDVASQKFKAEKAIRDAEKAIKDAIFLKWQEEVWRPAEIKKQKKEAEKKAKFDAEFESRRKNIFENDQIPDFDEPCDSDSQNEIENTIQNVKKKPYKKRKNSQNEIGNTIQSFKKKPYKKRKNSFPKNDTKPSKKLRLTPDYEVDEETETAIDNLLEITPYEHIKNEHHETPQFPLSFNPSENIPLEKIKIEQHVPTQFRLPLAENLTNISDNDVTITYDKNDFIWQVTRKFMKNSWGGAKPKVRPLGCYTRDLKKNNNNEEALLDIYCWKIYTWTNSENREKLSKLKPEELTNNSSYWVKNIIPPYSCGLCYQMFTQSVNVTNHPCKKFNPEDPNDRTKQNQW